MISYILVIYLVVWLIYLIGYMASGFKLRDLPLAVFIPVVGIYVFSLICKSKEKLDVEIKRKKKAKKATPDKVSLKDKMNVVVDYCTSCRRNFNYKCYESFSLNEFIIVYNRYEKYAKVASIGESIIGLAYATIYELDMVESERTLQALDAIFTKSLKTMQSAANAEVRREKAEAKAKQERKEKYFTEKLKNTEDILSTIDKEYQDEEGK